MSRISDLLDLASELEALEQTFIALDEALERGHDFHCRALFHPCMKLSELAFLIKDNLIALQEEKGTEKRCNSVKKTAAG